MKFRRLHSNNHDKSTIIYAIALYGLEKPTRFVKLFRDNVSPGNCFSGYSCTKPTKGKPTVFRAPSLTSLSHARPIGAAAADFQWEPNAVHGMSHRPDWRCAPWRDSWPKWSNTFTSGSCRQKHTEIIIDRIWWYDFSANHSTHSHF